MHIKNIVKNGNFPQISIGSKRNTNFVRTLEITHVVLEFLFSSNCQNVLWRAFSMYPYPIIVQFSKSTTTKDVQGLIRTGIFVGTAPAERNAMSGNHVSVTTWRGL